MHLRYGLNPHQQPASCTPIDPLRPPFRTVHSVPSYVNLLDALNSWQLVRTQPGQERWPARRDGLSLASDGALPFRDNVDQARRHGVRYLVEPGGSARSDEVAAACAERGIIPARTGIRLFHH